MRHWTARAFALAACLALGSTPWGDAWAQDSTTLRIHQFLPAQAPIPANFIAPWAKKVEEESQGRLKFELYPSMQLGGRPGNLYDQARDGVVDIVWTLLGYTPGRFPKAEAFDLPFMASSGEATSRAAWEFYEKHLTDELGDVKVIAVHTHGPGLIHSKNPIRSLDDMSGQKLRGPSRLVTNLIEKLGATAVGMPVPQVPESLSRGVIDGTVIPWEVTTPLRIAELVGSHTDFSGDRGLYTTMFVFVMNKAKYDALPDDLKKVIDDNSGLETAGWAGQVMDAGDVPGVEAAKARGNEIIILDEAETERWKEAAEGIAKTWIEEMNAKGEDGQALYDDAVALIEKNAAKHPREAYR